MLKFAVLLTVIGVTLAAVPKRNVSLLDQHLKIVGGTTTDISLHPFQVSVQYLQQHFCGGFLISANWVVTAAHCITQGYSTNLNIRAGSSRTTTGGQIAAVSRYILHENYRDATMDSDIALLYLSTSVNTANARAASLPAAGQVIADGSTATATGWGATRENGAGSASLLQVQVPTINRARCRTAYAAINHVTDNMFCAGLLGTGGKDACQGDSGGPVAVNGQVVGVVSWGYGCARAQYPGVYTKVSNFRTWIKRETGI